MEDDFRIKSNEDVDRYKGLAVRRGDFGMFRSKDVAGMGGTTLYLCRLRDGKLFQSGTAEFIHVG